MFTELSNKFGLDPYVLVEVAKSFANHIDAPKKQYKVFIEPLDYSTVVPEVIEQVNQISSPKAKEFVETPPYPKKVKENLLIAIANKSSKRSEAPYEQTDLKYQVSVIKQLNEEEPCDVYLCEDSTKVIQGKPTKVGKPIISCAIGTSCYHGLCDIGASISVIPYSI